MTGGGRKLRNGELQNLYLLNFVESLNVGKRCIMVTKWEESEVHTECYSNALKGWETGVGWKIILKCILEK
jgi:hypothetical protein